MSTPLRIVFGIGIAVLIVALFAMHVLTTQAHAQDDIGAWFKSLKQPGTGASCCDISDCHRVEAHFKNGQWWTRIPVPNGELTPIPQERILKDVTPIEDAVVCHANAGTPPTIYCFVPPMMSM